MSNTITQADAATQRQDFDTLKSEQAKTPSMTFMDKSGKPIIEPACDDCIKSYTWSNDEKAVIQKVLEFHILAEEFEVNLWQRAACQYSHSDWSDFYAINDLMRNVTVAPGPYALPAAQVRELLGSIHIAMSAAILTEEERSTAIDLLHKTKDFRLHIFTGHLSFRDHSDQLLNAEYIGSFSLATAWRFSSDLDGLPLKHVVKIFDAHIDTVCKEAKADAAKHHGGKGTTTKIINDGCSVVVDSLADKAAEWRQEIQAAEGVWDVGIVSERIHKHVFLIEELMNLGLLQLDPRIRSFEKDKLARAIRNLEDLIDWSACPALRKWLDQTDVKIDDSVPKAW